MRTYDPANGILYVHLAQDPAAPAPAPTTPPPPGGSCQQLPTGYANRSLETRLAADDVGTRPALVVLPGGGVAGTAVAAAAPALRLA